MQHVTGQTEHLQTLLLENIDINAKGDGGKTALMMAVATDKLELVSPF